MLANATNVAVERDDQSIHSVFTEEPLNQAAAREAKYTRVLMYLSLGASILAVIGMGEVVASRISKPGTALIDAFFSINIAFLMYGSLFYLLTRFAYFKRLTRHRPASREELEKVYQDSSPHPLLILIPSYREEQHVIRQTLMSAALTEYPDRRVVLLIDDPPNPQDAREGRALAATRKLVRDTDALFRAQQRRFASELAAFEKRQARGGIRINAEGRRVAELYRDAARWLESQAALTRVRNHYDELFVQRILSEPAKLHRERAREVEETSRSSTSPSAAHRIAGEYRRLAALFAVPITSFERKRFLNLPHAANKAMNLNSYLALIGRHFREIIRPDGLFLEECAPSEARFHIPDADYVITLDADSLLLHDYALRLTHVMDSPEAERYAVVESPYTAVPGTPSLVERMAGAQTDVQWIGSQGSTYFNASFWVGANALLRRAALEDICEIVYERGYPVRRYIQDHTLVEDTESSIDLVARGWKLFCYPERLSYSATPPDFGTLVIQRRRWANGPLLIVPKLIRYAVSSPRQVAKLSESLLRFYTLISATGAVSMLLMIAFRLPDAKKMPVVYLLIAAIPYYILYTRDLISCGYEWWDLPRMYALNLLLIPVNLVGIVKSAHQALTGCHWKFIRTPKVLGRTPIPPFYVLMPAVILFLILRSTLAAIADGSWTYGAFVIVNAVCLGYGILLYIGLEAGSEDVIGGLASHLRSASESVEVTPARAGPLAAGDVRA